MKPSRIYQAIQIDWKCVSEKTASHARDLNKHTTNCRHSFIVIIEKESIDKGRNGSFGMIMSRAILCGCIISNSLKSIYELLDFIAEPIDLE